MLQRYSQTLIHFRKLSECKEISPNVWTAAETVRNVYRELVAEDEKRPKAERRYPRTLEAVSAEDFIPMSVKLDQQATYVLIQMTCR